MSGDGVGLPPDYEAGGGGLGNTRAGAERIGDCLEVQSGGMGGGTTVKCVIPDRNPEGGGQMTSDARTRVMLVDGHQVMRDLLRDALENTGEFQVVAQAADGAEAVKMVEEIAPHVIVMDLVMPVMDGIGACREITDRLPDTRVLMLTASNEQEAVVRSIAAGATGYLQKHSGKEELLAALREVAEGEFRIPGSAARGLTQAVRSGLSEDVPEPLKALTQWEREILKLFAGGLTHHEIGEKRNIKALTVLNAMAKIQRKLGVRNRQELAVWAGRIGLSEDIPEPLKALTEREEEILKLYAQGSSYQEIGKKLNISAQTVSNAVSGIQRNLGFRSRQQLVGWAVRIGLADGSQT